MYCLKKPIFACILIALWVFMFAFVDAAEPKRAPKKESEVELCIKVAVTELEKVYCDILRIDNTIALPALTDFRRNTPATQLLLLKRPARRAGVTLPKLTGQNRRLEKAKAQAIRKVDPFYSSDKAKRPDDDTTITNTELNGCVLEKKAVICGNQRYILQLNVSNTKLSRSALTDSNRLNFPTESSFQSESDKRRYLWHCYQIYIEKMNLIGLGAATVPFTKFYYMYEEGKSKNVDFSKRFEKTYTFLKRDKLNLATKASYSDELPTSLQHCSLLSHNYIVCDKRSINWVFMRVNDQ